MQKVYIFGKGSLNARVFESLIYCQPQREFICNVQYEYYKEVVIKIRDKRKYSNWSPKITKLFGFQMLINLKMLTTVCKEAKIV